jgi:hypothetical protein
VENPKPLLGLGKEHELDTVLYTCEPPEGGEPTFVAHDHTSLSLGGPMLLGIFHFFVVNHFMVDEELHHFLMSNVCTPVAKTTCLLSSMVQQKYVNDLIKYYTCTIHGTVKTF